MATNKTVQKQPWEAFYIAGDFSKVLESGEIIASAPTSEVVAYDKTGADATSTVIEDGTITVDEQFLKVRIKGGTESGSPYKVSFRATTDQGNKWEVDAPVEVEEK